MAMDINNDQSKGDATEVMQNGLHLYPVSPHESGEGLPYAPVDWPQRGDMWSWKVGKRITSKGYFLDRSLYLPSRLQGKPKGRGFASKVSVEDYVRGVPGADVDAFFSSFSWKVPSRDLFKINGTKNELKILPATDGEITDHSGSESQSGTGGCKAGNKLCVSLIELGESLPESMFCDICCTEPGFCRDCCCILCSQITDSAYGGYTYIRCEAVVDEGGICGHIGHMECGFRTHLAGTVGGSIGLDAEYYCRRCDARTDLVPHVMKLFQTCQSVDSRYEIEKILGVGVRMLRGSRRNTAKLLLYHIQLVMEKLQSGICLRDVRWTLAEDSLAMEEDSSAVTPGLVSYSGNDAFESAKREETVDARAGSTEKLSDKFDPHMESLKLEIEIDQILETLRMSQELEYNIAKARLHEQKNYIHDLYQQLQSEKHQVEKSASYLADPEPLLQLVENRANQIKREIIKFKEMGQVAKGFWKASKETLKEYFGLEK